MSKNTSILLGDYFQNFVNQEIASGRYASVSEIVRDALRLLEEKEKKTKVLIDALVAGEQSGFIENFDWDENLRKIQEKYITE